MRKVMGLLGVLLVVATTARAHFVFMVPDASTRKVRVVFSDSTAPDKADYLKKIAHTKFATLEGGKLAVLKATLATNTLDLEVPGKEPSWVTGVCPYGVLAKGKSPFLLTYYAKALVGGDGNEVPENLRKPSAELKLDIVPLGKNVVQVLWDGKPLAKAEVVLYVPGKEEHEDRISDKDGKVSLPPAVKSGAYAIRVAHIATVKGESDGKRYDEERSYGTLVMWRKAELPR